MKNGWKREQLGELCEILDSQRKPITKRDRTAGKFPYYGATGIVDYVNNFIFDEPLVLVGEDGAKWESGASTAFRVDGKCWVNNHAHVLRPHRKTVLDNWLVHFLNHSDLTEFVSGLTVPKLNQGNLRRIPIPVPPLPEQQRIVGLLEEAFAGIATAKANAEKNLQSARALFESFHDSVFSRKHENWADKTLGEVCEYANGKAHERFIDKDGRFFVINSKFISTDGEVFKKSHEALLLLQPGDIAMVLSDVPNGKALAKCFLVEEANTYTLNQRICLIRSTKFHTKFLFYQINRNRHFLSFNNGENQTNLRLNQVLSCPLFLPPLIEQKTIADKLDAMSEETQRLASIYERKLAALEALKKSLLHQAFAGNL